MTLSDRDRVRSVEAAERLVAHHQANASAAGLAAPLCRNDHRIRHKAGWAYSIDGDGTITWHSPLGASYQTNNRDP